MPESVFSKYRNLLNFLFSKDDNRQELTARQYYFNDDLDAFKNGLGQQYDQLKSIHTLPLPPGLNELMTYDKGLQDQITRDQIVTEVTDNGLLHA